MSERSAVVDAVVARWHAAAARLAATDRGLSTALNYVLILGIVSILVTTLIFGFGGLVENQQETTSREQLEVIGNRIAADLGQVDTLAQNAADGNTVSVRADLPTRVVGATYTIEVDASNSRLILTTGDAETEVRVSYPSWINVEATTIHGGPVIFEVSSTGDSAEVVIRRA